MSLRSYVIHKIKSFERKFVAYNTISVSQSAVLHNFDLFQAMVPNGFVIPVLKANAYGHGLQTIATILQHRTFPYLAVDGYFEALRIQEVSSQPILVMGAIHPDNFAKMKLKGCTFVVSDIFSLTQLGQTKKKVTVHIELETGMGRHGVRLDELEDFLDALKQFPNIVVEGVMTHLADADNAASSAHVALQTKKFDEGVEKILAAGFAPKYIHLAQSAGSVKVQSRYANTLRVGIALYGITPLDSSDAAYGKLLGLQPTLTFTSTIAKIITVDAGDSVSYGCTFIAKRPSRIGVLPAGYYEGIPRTLSNCGAVKFGDAYLPIAGRVCMNHTMVDLTNSAASVGDTVTIVSAKAGDKVNVHALCTTHSIFPYEFLVGLNQNIRRSIIA